MLAKSKARSSSKDRAAPADCRISRLCNQRDLQVRASLWSSQFLHGSALDAGPAPFLVRGDSKEKPRRWLRRDLERRVVGPKVRGYNCIGLRGVRSTSGSWDQSGPKLSKKSREAGVG